MFDSPAITKPNGACTDAHWIILNLDSQQAGNEVTVYFFFFLKYSGGGYVRAGIPVCERTSASWVPGLAEVLRSMLSFGNYSLILRK
jgi:hypothetical protein